jgi:hypothetical protein
MLSSKTWIPVSAAITAGAATVACSTKSHEPPTAVVHQSASVSPTVVAGVPTCADIGLAGDSAASVFASTLLSSFSVFANSPVIGLSLGDGETATLTQESSDPATDLYEVFDFSATLPIDAVIVSAIQEDNTFASNVYAFSPGVTADTGLTSPLDFFACTDSGCPALEPGEITLCFPNPQTDGGACVPMTCDAAGANCGSITDGCGVVIECGPCFAPQTCGGGGTPNVCGCTPTTCDAAGAARGTIPDGCGGTIDCGSCG